MKIKKWELLAVVALLAACIGVGVWMYRPREGRTVAVITVDSKEYRRLNLWETPDRTFSIGRDTGKPVSFEVRDGKIRFVDVTCPDHVCEKAGWCSRPGDRAVCMPNRTTLVCYEEGEL